MGNTYREKLLKNMYDSIDISSEELDNTFYVKTDVVIDILDDLESKIKDIRALIETHYTLEAIEELKKLEKELY